MAKQILAELTPIQINACNPLEGPGPRQGIEPCIILAGLTRLMLMLILMMGMTPQPGRRDEIEIYKHTYGVKISEPISKYYYHSFLDKNPIKQGLKLRFRTDIGEMTPA